MERLVTIKTFDLVPLAELAKESLDSRSIPATLTDVNLVAMDWLIANAIGGIKLQVAESDVPRALQALDELAGENDSSQANESFPQADRKLFRD
jgi:hypothetical protein